MACLQHQQQLPFYGLHEPAPPVKKWSILLVQSLTARMPLLMATSACGLGRRCWSSPRQCCLHCFRTFNCLLLRISEPLQTVVRLMIKFDSQSRHGCVTTLGKLITPICHCRNSTFNTYTSNKRIKYE